MTTKSKKYMIWRPVKIATCYYCEHSGKDCTVIGLNSHHYCEHYYEYAKLPLCYICENILKEYHSFYVPITKSLRSMGYWNCEQIFVDDETFGNYKSLYFRVKEIFNLKKDLTSYISLLPLDLLNIITELLEHDIRTFQLKYKKFVHSYSIGYEHEHPIIFNCDWSIRKKSTGIWGRGESWLKELWVRWTLKK